MHFRYSIGLALCLASLSCTSLKTGTPSDAGNEDPDAGGMSGEGGMGGEAGNDPSGGMGGSGGIGGSGGMSGSGGMGGSGGMVPSDDCAAVDCVAGKTCIDGPTCVPTCSLDDSCDVGEECVEAADCSEACTNERCRPSCAPDCAVTDVCVEDNDCASDYCDRAGDALTGACRPDCSETDSCETGEPCSRTEDCAEGTCSGMLCHPICGQTESCVPGSACATSADCAGEDICHAVDRVCLSSCSGRTLASVPEFEAARYCWEIEGNLTLNPVPALATIDANVLPYLTDVTGDLMLADGSTTNSVTLPALSVVKGSVGAGNNYTGELHFPNLLEIGTFGSATTQLSIALTTATVIDLPKLVTIFGHLFIVYLPNLTTLNLPSLAAVRGDFSFADAPVANVSFDSLNMASNINGDIRIENLPNVPWTTLDDFVLPLNGDEIVNEVGCGTGSTCNCGNTSCVPPPTP